MITVAESTQAAFVLILVALALVNLCLWIRVLDVLRTRYPGTWERLGSPALIKNNNVANSLRAGRFIWGAESKKLGDRSLARLVTSQRIVQVVGLTTFILGLGFAGYMVWNNSAS